MLTNMLIVRMNILSQKQKKRERNGGDEIKNPNNRISTRQW